MPPVIQIEGLSKYYGSHRGVEDIDLSVEEGTVFGFLGPNAAGKTTTIRLLLDHIRPTRGRALIFGQDVRLEGKHLRHRIGFVPSEVPATERSTGWEALEFAARLRGGVDRALMRSLADRFSADLTTPVRTLSRGNRQKVAIISAFMHQPDLLILDEPTSGLDPLMQQEFNALVHETRAQGRTIFLSSHILPEVERVCDRVGIVRAGRLAAVEDVAALKRRALRTIEVRFAAPVSPAEFERLDGVQDVRMDGDLMRAAVAAPLDPFIKALGAHEVVDLTTHEPTLEEIVLAFYGPGPNGGSGAAPDGADDAS